VTIPELMLFENSGNGPVPPEFPFWPCVIIAVLLIGTIAAFVLDGMGFFTKPC